MTVVLFLRDGGAKTPCKRCSCSVIQLSGLLPREGGLISPRRWPKKSVQAAFSARNLHTLSNNNRFVVRDGISYSEACDPAGLGRKYTEGEPLPVEEAVSVASEILNILLERGV